MACTLGCFSFLSYFHIKPYLIQTHVTFKVLRKKMPRCGLATPRRNSTRVLDVMLVTTPTTMFLIVSSSKRCRAQVFGTFNIRTSSTWLLLPSLVSRMQRTWQQSWLVRTSSSWPRTGCTTVLQALRRAMSISSLGRIRRWRTSWLLSTNRSSRLTRQILKLMFFLKDIMQTLSGPKSCFANFFEGNQLPEPLLFVNVAFSTRMCARCKKLHVFFPQQNLHCKWSVKRSTTFGSTWSVALSPPSLSSILLLLQKGFGLQRLHHLCHPCLPCLLVLSWILEMLSWACLNMRSRKQSI